jgi:hypothetical protein
MNLLEYLKWRKEFNAEQEAKRLTRKEAQKREKEKEKIAELAGEIEGIEQSIKVYERASSDLVFSNHDQIAQMYQSLCKKKAQLDFLVEKEKERNEQ